MGIFNRIFGKQLSEKAMYWKENPNKLKEKEELGKEKLSKLNKYNTSLESLNNLSEIIACKNECEKILDWFEVLEDEECPYHITNGSSSFRENVFIRVNEAITRISKFNTDDFISCRNEIIENVPNTERTLKLLAEQTQKGFFIGYSDSWIETAKRLFNENQAFSFLDVYVECGMPKDIAYSKNPELITSYYPFQKNSHDYNVFSTYQRAIAERYDLSFRKLPFYEMNPADYNVNIPSSEEIIYIIYNVILYEEKIVRRNVAYSGMRWSNGLLRAGTLSVIGNEIKDFVPQDAGKIVITDKRIIFIGKQRNITKAISIKNIITYNLYKDGILLSQANKKALLLKFDHLVDYEIFSIQDGINQLIIVLNRILNNNLDEIS
jgi:hypothetical protein